MWADMSQVFFTIGVIAAVFGLVMVGVPILVSRVYDARDREMGEILEGVMTGLWIVGPWVMLCAITNLVLFVLTGAISWAVE